jgi:flagellar hook-basal body complex protein FliE
MDYLSIEQVHGDIIKMQRTDPQHLARGGVKPQEQPEKGTGFSAFFTDALNKVNDVQQESTQLLQQMITDPDSVDAHDVTIALAKANTSLSIAKSVTDAGLRAYRDIISIR